jgi:hypothetical protein
MKMNPLGKFCPSCHQKNDDLASVCVFCGAWLEEGIPTNVVSVPENPGGHVNTRPDFVDPVIEIAAIPENGLGIHVMGQFKPAYVQVNPELVLGRRTEASLEAMLDLSDMDGANLGVSRRHAMIRRTATGFEVIDLSSRNGTWLNAERLIPNKPYPFASGSQLRIGQMRLLIMYRPVL